MTNSRDLSGTSLAQFFEHEQFVGEILQYSCGVQSAGGGSHSGYWPHRAYFCPVCGELWGREILTHHFTYRPLPSEEWVVVTSPCAEHGGGEFLSLHPSIEQANLAILTRELLVLLQRYE